MSRPLWICYSCGERHFKKNPHFCNKCGAPLDEKEYQEWLKPRVNEPEPDPEIKPDEPELEPESKEEPMDKINKRTSFRWMKTILRWLWIILIILTIVSVVYIAYRMATGHQIAQTNNYVPVYVAPAPKPTAVPVYVPQPEDNYVIVVRGKTDQETINYNDAWPGYHSHETFNWFDNRGFSNIHLKGGTFIMPCDGVISGDVVVNGVEVYDSNQHTFLVINVKKGNLVYVNPDWQARFTTELSMETVVMCVQAQFPSWTRQYSRFN